jgi:hypothetical protein
MDGRIFDPHLIEDENGYIAPPPPPATRFCRIFLGMGRQSSSILGVARACNDAGDTL